jgi:hypothetical protein
MSRWLLAFAALALAACAPAPQQSAPVALPAPAVAAPAPFAACLAQASRTLDFTGPQSQDRLEAIAYGPSCETAIIVLSLRKADGAALWAAAAPYSQMSVADAALPPASPDILRQFLETMLAGARITSAANAPEWPTDRPEPAQEETAFEETQLPREFYALLKARRAPMACLPFGHHSQTCLYYDAASDGAGELFTSSN